MGSDPRAGGSSGPASGGLFRHRSPSPATTLAAWALVAAQLGLIAGLVVWSPRPDWSPPPVLKAAGTLLKNVGLVWMGVATVSLGRSLTPLPLPLERGRLRTGGLYRLSRHPIYTGLLAFAFGTALRAGSVGTVLVASALAVLLSFKARLEERHLRVAYPGYADYQARTPRFLPTGGLFRH